MRLAAFHTALWILVVAGFYLRVQGVGVVGYNLDEVEKAQAAQFYLAGHFHVDMEHPMLLKSLLALAFALFEPHEATARTLIALLGAGTIPLLYLLAARLFDPVVGLISAAFLAVSPYAVAMHHTVKEDTLAVLCWLFALHALCRVRDGCASSLYWAAVGLGLAWASKLSAPFLMLLMAAACMLFWDIRKPLKDAMTSAQGSDIAGPVRPHVSGLQPHRAHSGFLARHPGGRAKPGRPRRTTGGFAIPAQLFLLRLPPA